MVVFHWCSVESERTETAIQTDLPPQRTSADTTRSVGPTTLFKDTPIRGEETKRKKESLKTALLLALSRPSRPISRSQSQATISGDVRVMSTIFPYLQKDRAA